MFKKIRFFGREIYSGLITLTVYLARERRGEGVGGELSPPHLKNTIIFERSIVLTWNFMTFSKIDLALDTWQKCFLLRTLLMSALFSDTKKWKNEKNGFTLFNVTGVVFRYFP